MARPIEHAGMTWEEVCNDANLRDLPYKIELNEWGQIVMSPTRLRHGAFQVRIAELLKPFLQTGQILVESAVKTEKGTKVPDVAWFGAERWERVKDEFEASVAPEICVEALSRGNAAGEIRTKRQLYFDAGADEVWICDEQGNVQFFSADGPLKRSGLVPDFPTHVEL